MKIGKVLLGGIGSTKKLKNKYERVLQQNFGYGWDDIWSWDTDSSFYMNKKDGAELKRLKSEYRANQPGADLRVISRKTPLK